MAPGPGGCNKIDKDYRIEFSMISNCVQVRLVNICCYEFKKAFKIAVDL
jgi:hypothetical protein